MTVFKFYILKMLYTKIVCSSEISEIDVSVQKLMSCLMGGVTLQRRIR